MAFVYIPKLYEGDKLFDVPCLRRYRSFGVQDCASFRDADEMTL